MDLIRIGSFLAELRREKGLTQQALGERLGVTNKTISRWETGCYLPGIRCQHQRAGCRRTACRRGFQKSRR